VQLVTSECPPRLAPSLRVRTLELNESLSGCWVGKMSGQVSRIPHPRLLWWLGRSRKPIARRVCLALVTKGTRVADWPAVLYATGGLTARTSD
jgi:hypothetical protein